MRFFLVLSKSHRASEFNLKAPPLKGVKDGAPLTSKSFKARATRPSGCVIVLLMNNGSIGVPWKERKPDWMGEILMDHSLELAHLPNKIEVSLLDDNNQMVLAPILLQISLVAGKPQAK